MEDPAARAVDRRPSGNHLHMIGTDPPRTGRSGDEYLPSRVAGRTVSMYPFDTSTALLCSGSSAKTLGQTSRRWHVRGRSDVLEPAILGLLHQTPMHGYELRKRLNVVLGSFRALSYGSLYPCLRSLVERGWIVGSDSPSAPPHALSGKRARIVYELTADGKEKFQEILSSSGPATWEDENFDVRFAFFAQTDAETRLRILEGRRSRLTERLDIIRQSFTRTRERMDEYT